MAGLDEWLAVARSGDADEIRERILTGFKSGKPFTPYIPTIALPESPGWVLDFGCGIGRNFPYLKGIARHVCGFDLAPMIQRCCELSAVSVDLLLDDWAQAKARTFDLVFAALVVQHVDTATCRRYLLDFATMSPVTYLLTRVHSDFDANVLELVAEADVFQVATCVEVEHDSGTNQLRAVGQRSFDEARRSPGGGHYELLLRSTQL